MSREMSESEWKVLRQVHPVALERFSRRVLDEIGRVMSDRTRSSHERYLAVYRIVHERNREMANVFNDLRRSTALVRLTAIRSRELLTEEEFLRFTPETRETVSTLSGISDD